MNHYPLRTVLFDLDGTLTDPKVGITASVRYAMVEMKRPLAPETNLDWCIGPPLHDSFRILLQTDDPALIEQGVTAFREYFSVTGLLENEVYDGIPDLLTALYGQGMRCYVATAKPTVYAEKIIAHFGLNSYFVRVYGSELDGRNARKEDLIRHILQAERLSAATTMMVGDRKYDIVGAKKNGLRTTAVSYGYGSIDEINAAQPDFIAHAPSEIGTICIRQPSDQITIN